MDDRCFDSTELPLYDLSSWDSLAAFATSQRILFISWKPPHSRFVKINFDGNIRGGRGGLEYIIRDQDSRLLAVRGSPLFKPSIPDAELCAAWTDVLCAIRELRIDRIIIEGDSMTIIDWIRGEPSTTRLTCSSEIS